MGASVKGAAGAGGAAAAKAGAGVKWSLFGKGGNPSGDIVQGALQDVWLLGALAALTTKPELVKALFVKPSPQGLECGIHTVAFYKDGKRVEVTVDDRLPCTQEGRLLFGRARDASELWVALVEKAYAKLHGCYENLGGGSGGGSVAYALRDLTGGVAQV